MKIPAKQADPVRSTHQYVAGTLRQAILGGRLVPGQRLVEADLTRDLGVSRGPVREALRQLTAEGMVEAAPNQTAIVRRYSKREMVELFEIRIEMEALAARRLAERIDEDDIRERFIAATRQIGLDHTMTSSASYFEENRLFHQAIADLCGNEWLATLVRQFQLPLIMFQLNGAIRSESIQDSVAEHGRIAKVILDGDPRKASNEIRKHLKRASALLDDMPAAIYRP
jgi:DNA-binding GntR family transcriptional regulator